MLSKDSGTEFIMKKSHNPTARIVSLFLAAILFFTLMPAMDFTGKTAGGILTAYAASETNSGISEKTWTPYTLGPGAMQEVWYKMSGKKSRFQIYMNQGFVEGSDDGSYIYSDIPGVVCIMYVNGKKYCVECSNGVGDGTKNVFVKGRKNAKVRIIMINTSGYYDTGETSFTFNVRYKNGWKDKKKKKK